MSTSFEFGNICVYSATLRPDNSSLSEEVYNDKILINIVLTQGRTMKRFRETVEVKPAGNVTAVKTICIFDLLFLESIRFTKLRGI